MKRYSEGWDGEDLYLDADGSWVRYEDAQDAIGEALEDGNDLCARALAVADELERQLAEVTRERDTLKAMVDLHDALNDRRRAQANQTPFKRRKYENE